MHIYPTLSGWVCLKHSTAVILLLFSDLPSKLICSNATFKSPASSTIFIPNICKWLYKECALTVFHGHKTSKLPKGCPPFWSVMHLKWFSGINQIYNRSARFFFMASYYFTYLHPANNTDTPSELDAGQMSWKGFQSLSIVTVHVINIADTETLPKSLLSNTDSILDVRKYVISAKGLRFGIWIFVCHGHFL